MLKETGSALHRKRKLLSDTSGMQSCVQFCKRLSEHETQFDPICKVVSDA